VKIPSNSSFQLQCKNMSMHKMTSSFGFKEFEGTQEESAYWNAAKEDERSSLKKKHVDTGLCLLCLIDEQLPKKRPPPPKVVEAEPAEQARKPAGRKIAGGMIARSHEKVEVSTPNLKVSWSWYNEAQGLVIWTFQNMGTQQASAILLRNSYYFGNAFWPIYENNPAFGTPFATKLEPLVDKTVQNNSPPLALISWKQEDGSYKNIIAFVFTLAQGQTWQMLEGGFSMSMPPQNVSAYEVSFLSEGEFCLGYDPQQVRSWDQQTGTNDQGYSPNPSTFHLAQVLAPPEAQYQQLLNDPIQQGACESVAKEAIVSPDPSAPQTESRLWGLLSKNAGSLDKR
jgi:hypothetical protein